MSKGWKTLSIVNQTEHDRDAIGEIVYECLIEAGYSPSDINWELKVEFFNDPEDE